MELTARRGERRADERCPYCHDALVAPAEDLVTCPGCATDHHRACVEELGRCTIRGCERPLALEGVAAAEPDPSAGRARRASVTEEIRRRLRERVRHFVAEHATPVPDGPPLVHHADPEVTDRPPVGRLLDGPPAPRPRPGPLARDAGARGAPYRRAPPRPEEPPTVPRDPVFAGLLRDAQRAAREAPLAERADHCRRVAELLRLPPAGHEVPRPEDTARNYELRAAELERLAAHAGAGLPLWAVVVVIALLTALLITLAYLASQ